MLLLRIVRPDRDLKSDTSIESSMQSLNQLQVGPGKSDEDPDFAVATTVIQQNTAAVLGRGSIMRMQSFVHKRQSSRDFGDNS
jgi:hypothetical protein